MKTTWDIKTKKKTNTDEETHEITFKDYRGEHTVKIENGRQLVEDLDKAVNWTEKDLKNGKN